MSRLWLGLSGCEQLLPDMNRELEEQDIEIVREARTASGRMVVDIIARKKRFLLRYSIVTDEVLSQLRSMYLLGPILSLKVERADSSVETYTVRIKPFGRSRYIAAGQWFWKDITIELEEL